MWPFKKKTDNVLFENKDLRGVTITTEDISLLISTLSQTTNDQLYAYENSAGETGKQLGAIIRKCKRIVAMARVVEYND